MERTNLFNGFSGQIRGLIMQDINTKTIKELRTLTGLSQSKFASYLEIPVKTIQSWESGIRKPPAYINKLIERVIAIESSVKGRIE